jgi:hypothetical protein
MEEDCTRPTVGGLVTTGCNTQQSTRRALIEQAGSREQAEREQAEQRTGRETGQRELAERQQAEREQRCSR